MKYIRLAGRTLPLAGLLFVLAVRETREAAITRAAWQAPATEGGAGIKGNGTDTRKLGSGPINLGKTA